MSSPSSDPQPEDTPGLDRGNSVAPGDTPPVETGTSGLSSPDSKEPSRGANKAIAIGVVALIALVVIFFVVKAILQA